MTDDRRHLVAVAALAITLVAVGVGVLAVDCGSSSGQVVVHGEVDVSVSPSNETGTPGRITVTWVDAGSTPNDPCPDGAHLEAESTKVDREVGDGDQGVGEVEVTNGTRQLRRVGASVTLSEKNPREATRLDLWTTATDGERRTVTLDRTVTL